jgi:hypothetical protein
MRDFLPILEAAFKGAGIPMRNTKGGRDRHLRAA